MGRIIDHLQKIACKKEAVRGKGLSKGAAFSSVGVARSKVDALSLEEKKRLKEIYGLSPDADLRARAGWRAFITNPNRLLGFRSKGGYPWGTLKYSRLGLSRQEDKIREVRQALEGSGLSLSQLNEQREVQGKPVVGDYDALAMEIARGSGTAGYVSKKAIKRYTVNNK